MNGKAIVNVDYRPRERKRLRMQNHEAFKKIEEEWSD